MNIQGPSSSPMEDFISWIIYYVFTPKDELSMVEGTNSIVYNKYFKATVKQYKNKWKVNGLGTKNQLLNSQVKSIECEMENVIEFCC